MLDTNATADDDSQYFKTPRQQNISENSPITQVTLGYDTLKCNQNITTHITRQKLSPYRK